MSKVHSNRIGQLCWQNIWPTDFRISFSFWEISHTETGWLVAHWPIWVWFSFCSECLQSHCKVFYSNCIIHKQQR